MSVAKREHHCLSPSDIQSGSKIQELPHVFRPAKKSNQLLAIPLDLRSTRYYSKTIKWHTRVTTIQNHKKLTYLSTCYGIAQM